MVQTVAAPRGDLSGSPADQRRREILLAAAAAFRRHGVAATGMREIAAELGVTAGSLYYYFQSKDDLLAFCQETTLDGLLAAAAEIAVRPVGHAERLRALVVAHLVCLNESFPGSLAHLEIESIPAALAEPLRRKRKRYEQLVGRWIADGVAAGELGASDPGLAAKALLGALNWSVKWFSAEGAKDATEVGERFADLFLGGLAPRRPEIALSAPDSEENR